MQIYERARSLGSVATLAQVQTVLSGIDRAAKEATELGRYQAEIWDQVSPLAGQPPEYWLQRGDLPAGGEVFCIRVDGMLQIVQPHDPNQSGLMAMDTATAQQRAEEHIAQMIAAVVDQEVLNAALLQLL
ncbi:MAG TPA: hypothetical protein VGK74_02790 [Symbiobacteriaceae bacterium]